MIIIQMYSALITENIMAKDIHVVNMDAEVTDAEAMDADIRIECKK